MDVVRVGSTSEAPAKDPAQQKKILDAARQFEALLMEQLLRGMRGEGWLGGGEDGAGSVATEFAEQQLSGALSSQGGLGLATLVVKGLDRGN